MAPVKMFYCFGTKGMLGTVEYVWNLEARALSKILALLGKGKDEKTVTIPGWGGGIATAVAGIGVDDAFPSMVDTTKIDVTTVVYPARGLGIGNSIDVGVGLVIDEIEKLTPGTPIILGGYSQGAAVVSSVLNEIQSGSLTAYSGGFLGGVCFGNPRRKLNYRGPVGGTWSGTWYVEGSTTGGHGSFPTSGDYARLTSVPDTWVEFAQPGDCFTSIGDTADELLWVDGNEVWLSNGPIELGSYWTVGLVPDLIAAAGVIKNDMGFKTPFTDINGVEVDIPGGGHTLYPMLPPPGDPDDGLTCYQIALKYISTLADEWATSYIGVPETQPGWSTTLIPPAV